MTVEKQTLAETAEETLAFTQNVRRRMAAHLMGIQMAGDGTIPNDPDQQRILLTTVDGMDKTVLTAKKIEADVKQGDADRAASLMIAKVMSHAHIKGNIYETDQVPENFTLPEHPEILYEGEISKAELEQGPANLSYNEFKANYESNDGQ